MKVVHGTPKANGCWKAFLNHRWNVTQVFCCATMEAYVGKDIYIYEDVGVPFLWRPKLATEEADM